MAVILSSFENAGKHNGLKFSVAGFPPKGTNYKSIKCLAPIDNDGGAISMKGKTAEEYKKAVSEAYKSRWPQIAEWLTSLKSGVDVVLLCWCPYSKSSEEHLRQTGNFPCHSGLIGQMIQKHRPDIEVIMDEDREISLLQIFRPVRSDCLKCCHYEAETPCSWERYCAGPYVYQDGSIRSVNPKYMSAETKTIINGDNICVTIVKNSAMTTSQTNLR